MPQANKTILRRAIVELIELQQRSSWQVVTRRFEKADKESYLSYVDSLEGEALRAHIRAFCQTINLKTQWFSDFYKYLLSRYGDQ